MIFEEIVESSAYSRPGFALAAFKEAALPIYQLTARVITLEKKPISPVEEACLKAIDAGLDNPEDICGFLGLEMQMLKGVLANLNSHEQINYTHPIGATSAKVLLTAKGRAALELAEIVQPEERLVKIVFDPFLKKVVFLPVAGLFRPKEVREKGWLEIPLCGVKRPDVENISLADIDKAIWRMGRGQNDIRELLSIRRIERRELLFSPCVALFYRSTDHKEVQVAFHREEGLSLEHEIAFAEAGGPTAIGAMHALEPQALPQMDDRPEVMEKAIAAAAKVEAIEKPIIDAALMRV